MADGESWRGQFIGFWLGLFFNFVLIRDTGVPIWNINCIYFIFFLIPGSPFGPEKEKKQTDNLWGDDSFLAGTELSG